MNYQTKKYWIELAKYDLDTAVAMQKTKRYLYVGYMCHQVTEKILKAYYVHKTKKIPPYTHNLDILANKVKISEQLTEAQQDLLDDLEPLNIEARYPKHKTELLKYLNDDKCQKLIKRTRKFYRWIESLIIT